MPILHTILKSGTRYPAHLRVLPGSPDLLYAYGNLDLLQEPMISVVGSRRMSGYGQKVVESFVPQLCKAGLSIVSGLAYGVDGHAHRVVLANSGRCVAVLGGGLERVYPVSHQSLFREIIKNEGLVLSEYPPTASPRQFTFLHRNRIIAGLSHATVIVEAGEGSGTLGTARYVLDYGRELCVVPGDIFSREGKGIAQLLKSGARPVMSATDILELYGKEAVKLATEPLRPALTGSLATVYSFISQKPCSEIELQRVTAHTTAELASVLSILELDGYIAQKQNLWQTTL